MTIEHMTAERLTEIEVRGYDNQKLVGQFEILSRFLLRPDVAARGLEIRQKNHNMLAQEIFRRMGG